MQRLLTATVATSIAASLSLTAATATEKSSSEVTDFNVYVALGNAHGNEDRGRDGFGSSVDLIRNFAPAQADDSTSSEANDAINGRLGTGSSTNTLWPTFKSDVHNGWKPGTTLDIILGVGIGAVVALLLGAGATAADKAGFIDLPF